ncbi:leucine-rich repeat domain-containing protein [Acaryochloris sp. CCMEE 5410]|uniref:leucine-rich repeat domain-containing protein n=1 Tax=Acaryochloris sp. CCMEE 5410 TaxID=310037 RepID=UPI0002483E2C|nr:leucine-rich repeat domain-containing protein [Acaryochloris sp. CCMEE 5410]KAI9129568.1 leucine-rich repeat domain-containing protein [Acaryochloris sp. CCMEE 5410]
MSQIRKFSQGIVVLVVLATALCHEADRKDVVVLANPVQKNSTHLAQSQLPKDVQNYFEAQHRIQVAQETQASELDLSGLSLTQVPIAIMQLTKLQSLNLSGNKMSSLPPEILWLTKLQSLNLSSNQLSSLPPGIGQLTKLQTLDLRGNKLSSLPVEIEKLRQSTKITVEGNPLPPHILEQYEPR